MAHSRLVHGYTGHRDEGDVVSSGTTERPVKVNEVIPSVKTVVYTGSSGMGTVL